MSDAHSNTDQVDFLDAADAAVGGSSRGLNAAKRACPAERLPPELLCDALAYLCLRGRMRASQVSQYWRAAALESPQLWAKIWMSCSTPINVERATTLMSRAGSIADVAIVSYYPTREIDWSAPLRAEGEGEPDEDEENDFDTIILPYLGKIRSLWWSSRRSIRSLCYAAPFLEKLHVTKELYIQPDFLSGGSGRLRTLRCGIAHFPVSCPALSCIADLRIDDLQVDPVTGVPTLFHLLPRLESLFVGGLRHEHSHVLLSGPPPACLRALTLKSSDPEWDMTRHFVDLYTPDLRIFAVDIAASGRAILDAIPEPLMCGATALRIREPHDSHGSWFFVAQPGAREHSLAIPELCVPELTQLIIARGAARLHSIRTLDITIDVLEHFVAVVNAIPALETVTIHLETFGTSGPPRHPDTEIVGWDALEYLQAVLDAAPQLRTPRGMPPARSSTRATPSSSCRVWISSTSAPGRFPRSPCAGLATRRSAGSSWRGFPCASTQRRATMASHRTGRSMFRRTTVELRHLSLPLVLRLTSCLPVQCIKTEHVDGYS